MAKHNFTIYKLHFTSPVHLGDARDDYGISLKTIASDTMYAALISCMAKQGKPIPDNGDLGCTISSLFPFYQKDKDSQAVLFFPKPLKQTLPDTQRAVVERKKIKKVSWLDNCYFSKILKGEQLFDDVAIDNIKGEYLTNQIIDKDFVVSQVSPRVTISRDGHEDAKPFYMDRIMFKDYSGLFFMAEGDTALMESALALLQSEGIGTDRNVGNGFFEYENPEKVELDLPETSNYAMALSSFVPESKEQLQEMLDSDYVAYDFQRRGGWITTSPHNTLRKNVVYAFTAGSVFKTKSNELEVKGKVGVNLVPDILKNEHPIWRNGRAMFIPIKIK